MKNWMKNRRWFPKHTFTNYFKDKANDQSSKKFQKRLSIRIYGGCRVLSIMVKQYEWNMDWRVNWLQGPGALGSR